MKFENVIEGYDISKKYKGFTLTIDRLDIPKGFATALIGENGAGKTTLIDIMAGTNLDYKGHLTYFSKYSISDRDSDPIVRNKIGYTGTNGYFLPQWTLKQVEELQGLLFAGFDDDRYHQLCRDLAICGDGFLDQEKKVSGLSDGNRTKLMIAGVLARDTDLLIMDEPASPLDPLMRDKLCQLIRSYLNEKEGEKSVIFSTHNISDMEDVTDYAIIIEQGRIVEQGFVEDLKEKYIYVKGDKEDQAAADSILYSLTSNHYGFEGLCLAENLDKLAGLNLTKERPSLSQIAVAVMRNYSKLR